MTLRGGRYEIIRASRRAAWPRCTSAARSARAGSSGSSPSRRLHPHLAAEPEFVEMFLDEARLAARIRHPNVVATLDVAAGRRAALPGHGVRRGRRRSSLLRPLRREAAAAAAGRSRCGSSSTRSPGLHAAHELTGADGEPLNLVHRDVSPQNILVGVDGIARITDFGVARAESRLSTTAGRRGQGQARVHGAGADPARAHRPPHRRLRGGRGPLGDARGRAPLPRRQRRRSS